MAAKAWKGKRVSPYRLRSEVDTGPLVVECNIEGILKQMMYCRATGEARRLPSREAVGCGWEVDVV